MYKNKTISGRNNICGIKIHELRCAMTNVSQKSMELQLFQVKESTVNNPDGSVRINKTTKVTGKGQQYFINKFLKE